MLFAAVILALVSISGAQAQCVAESNGVNYTYCGRVAVFNVYWTPLPDQTNIIFETLDDGWHALGFGSGDAPMAGANVIFGCDDFDLATVQAASGIDDLEASPWDAVLGGRTVAIVAAGFASNNLAIDGTITQTRADGICAIRFERLNVIDEIEDEGQHILEGIANTVVVARGAGDVPAQHLGDERAAASQNFMDGTGTIADVPIVSLLAVDDGGDDDDASAGLASLSTLLLSAVAALTVALW